MKIFVHKKIERLPQSELSESDTFWPRRLVGVGLTRQRLGGCADLRTAAPDSEARLLVSEVMESFQPAGPLAHE